MTNVADFNTAADTHGRVPFERIFDATPTLIGVYQGPEHIYLYRNPTHDRAFSGRVLMGRKLRDAIPELVGQGIIQQMDNVFDDGMPVEVPEVEIDLGLDPSGSMRRFYRYSLQAWFDEKGAVAGVMSFAFDVTEQVEGRLRAEANERHLSFALKVSSAVGIFEWDTKKDAIKADPRFLKGFGMDPSQATDTLPVADFLAKIHDNDRDRVVDAINRAVATGDDYEEQYRLTSHEGFDRHVLSRGRCLRDRGGNPDRFVGIVVDITKQFQDEQALRESEARLRTVFSSIDQGYCVAEIIQDEDGTPVDYRFIEVNPQFEEMTGLKEATGRRVMEMVPDLEPKWVEIYARVALGGETIRFEEGSKAMGRWYDVFATPVAPKGRFALVFRNVTLKRTIQETLRKSEAAFRTITEAMPQMVWATRPDGYHDFYNARWYEFTGVPLGSTDGDGWSGLFHADDKDAAWARWQHSLATGEPYEVEYRLRHHSGEYRWTLGRAQAVRDGDGEIERWLGTCTDIHALKVAAEQRQLLLDEMNHRVKNTLAIISVMVSQTLRNADSLQQASAAIQARIHMLSGAHDRMVNAKWSQTHIVEVVKTALAPHRTGEGRISIEGPDIAIGAKQALALTMALHELATNAGKYGALSGASGKVSIGWSVGRDGDEDVFRFSWTETDGPPVTAPERRGFGSRMIEQALAGYFNGKAELNYPAKGLTFELTAPLLCLTA